MIRHALYYHKILFVIKFNNSLEMKIDSKNLTK